MTALGPSLPCTGAPSAYEKHVSFICHTVGLAQKPASSSRSCITKALGCHAGCTRAALTGSAGEYTARGVLGTSAEAFVMNLIDIFLQKTYSIISAKYQYLSLIERDT